jgi:hypothetical protein
MPRKRGGQKHKSAAASQADESKLNEQLENVIKRPTWIDTALEAHGKDHELRFTEGKPVDSKYVAAFDGFWTLNQVGDFTVCHAKRSRTVRFEIYQEMYGVLNRGALIRKIVNKQRSEDPNAEITKNLGSTVLTQELYGSENDYIVYFTLNLIGAFCWCGVQRFVIVELLHFFRNLVKKHEITYTREHKRHALDLIEKCKANLLFEYLQELDLLVPRHYVELRIADALSREQFEEGATAIDKFQMHAKFNVYDLCLHLASMNRKSEVTMLADKLQYS